MANTVYEIIAAYRQATLHILNVIYNEMKKNHISILAALITLMFVNCNEQKDNNKIEKEDWVVAADELHDNLTIKINPNILTYQENDLIKIEVDLYSKSHQFENNEYQTTYSFEKPIDLGYWHVDSTRWFKIATNNQILIPEGLKKGSYQVFINCEVNVDAGVNRNFERTLNIE